MQKDFKQLLVVFIFCVIMLGGLLATSYNPDAFAIMLAVVLPLGGLILSGVYVYRERRFNWLLPAEILIFMVFPGILMQWMLIAEIGLIPAGGGPWRCSCSLPCSAGMTDENFPQRERK